MVALFLLSGRPCHLSPTQDVDVEMWDRLPPVIPRIDHQPIPRLVDRLTPGDIRRTNQEVTQQNLVFRLRDLHPRKRFLWNHQNVVWSLRADIPESKTEFIIVNDVRRDLATNDFSENSIFRH